MTGEYEQIPGWRHLRERYLALWNRQVLDALFIAHIQNLNQRPPAPEPWMIGPGPDKYVDPARFLRYVNWRQSQWNWHTDLFHYKTPSIGPNMFLSFCGAEPVYGATTVWYKPMINDLAEADRVHFSENNRRWREHLDTVDYFVNACAGNEQIGTTDMGGPADLISVLMGAENFLIQTVENPGRMRDFALRLAGECNQAFDIIYRKITSRNDGNANWMPMWSDRPMGSAQDDMAINFSPELYRDVFLPALSVMAAHTGRTVLHWHDGCAHHLDAILGVEAISLIQYGHDPNTGSFRDQLPAMQKIQAAGKILFISCVDACDAEFFIDNLDPRGLAMIINTGTDEASKQMEEDCRKWTGRRLDQLASTG